MQAVSVSLILSTFSMIIMCLSIVPALALDPNPGIQDLYSAPSTGTVIPPHSSGREAFPFRQQTTDQKFAPMFSKLAMLEQTVATLQNQVNAQAQLLAQLKQVISINSSGTITIQAPGTLKIMAGGTMSMTGSLIDMNAPITGAHGLFKADTLMTTNVIAQTYTPGAGNIW